MSRNRVGALGALLLLAGVLSCGREVIGPDGHRGPRGTINFAPYFANSVEPVPGDEAFAVTDLVVFTHVRVRILRQGVIIVDRTVAFPASADSVNLAMSVPLLSSSSQGEVLQATLKYYNNSTGDTVFTGGPLNITVRPGPNANPLPVLLPLTYVGPGSQAVSVQLGPDSILATNGQNATLTATAYDAQENVVPNAVVGFISRDPSRVFIPNQGAGTAQIVGARGSTYVVAQLISGQRDSVKIAIDPRPSAMLQMSGNAQQALQGTAFAQPLRVRITAIDGGGVQGWPVKFKVTAGLGKIGSVGGPVDSLIVSTDTGGYAQVPWTAGDTAMIGSVTASIPAPALNVVFNGTQLSSAPTTLAFQTQPTSFTSGATMSAPQVAVRNGAGTTITSYTGPVRVQLTGGTAGAKLVGDTIVAAVAGIATFSNLTVDRGGTNYRLNATVAGATSQQSNTFNVAAAPPASITLHAGGGQSASANSALADSIKVRVLDVFGFPVPGVTVTFNVAQGGGSVSPASGATDANGVRATAWTLGASGTQTITATVSGVAAFPINATVIGAGPTVLFFGNDYTYVPVGQTYDIPIFLSAPSGSPIWVQLTTYDATAAWTVDSVVFAPGVTRVDVGLTGLVPNPTMVFATSSVGSDSLFVNVDSAWVSLANFDESYFTPGDTVFTVVRLSDPAPTGGVTVIVRSLDTLLAMVATGDGSGTPQPACVSSSICGDGGGGGGDDLRAAPSGDASVIGALADSAVIFIPEGELAGHLVVFIRGEGIEGYSYAYVSVEAPGHRGDTVQFYMEALETQLNTFGGTLSLPMGVGQRIGGYLQRTTGAQTRDHRFQLVSRNPAVMQVDSVVVMRRLEFYSDEFYFNAQAAGSTYVVWSENGVAIDSAAVNVVAPRLAATVNTASGKVHTSATLFARPTVSGELQELERTTDLAFTARSNDTSVVRLERAGGIVPAGKNSGVVPFTFVGVGSTYLVVEAAGHAVDSVFVNVTLSGITSHAAGAPIGVGMVTEFMISLPATMLRNGPRNITVSTVNPGNVRILTPTVELSQTQVTGFVLVEGLSPGSAELHLDGDSLLTSIFYMPVVTPQFITDGVPGAAVADSTLLVPIGGFLFDGATARPPADTLYAVLRSSDPSIVQVVDSIVTWTPDQPDAFEKATIRVMQPGDAWVRLYEVGSLGYTPSDSAQIFALPFELAGGADDPYIGLGMRVPGAVHRNSSDANALALTITHSNPGVVHFLVPFDSIPAGASHVLYDLVGDAIGVDTITFAAAGHAPFATVVEVTPAGVQFIHSVTLPVVGETDAEVGATLYSTFWGNPRATDIPRKFVLAVSDTTMAKVLQDTIAFEPGETYASRSGSVQYTGLGNVTLFLQDVDSAIAPMALPITTTFRQLTGANDYSDDALVMGMGQRTWDDEAYVSRGYYGAQPMWVHLKSSKPGVATVPDSVLIGAGEMFEYFNVVAGDTTGSARITASAPGFNDWQFDVFVTRTVAMHFHADVFVGARTPTAVFMLDAMTLTARPMAAPTALRFVSENDAIATGVGSDFVLPANNGFFFTPGALGVAVGATTVHLEDTRGSVFDAITHGSNEIEVLQPFVKTDAPEYSIGLGMTSTGAHLAVTASYIRDSVWVRLASVGGRFSTNVDSVLVYMPALMPSLTDGFSLSPVTFQMTGLAVGVDTLIVSADGVPSDTVIVQIGQSILRAGNIGTQTIVQGDSVWVPLELRDANGGPAMTDTPHTLTISTPAAFVATNGSSTITTLPIASGGATTAGFWLRAVSGGTGDVTISGTTFRPLRLTFTTRAPAP